MDVLSHLLVAAHILGLSLIVGPFFLQMRASWGFAFPLMLIGASVQLVTGVSLYAIEIATDEPNHMKLGIKGLIAIVVFVAALVGFLQQRRIEAQKAGLTAGSTGAAAPIGGIASATDQRRLKPFFHVAGGMAVVNVLIATLWR